MLEELVLLDRELFLFLNNLGSESWDGFWLTVTNKWFSIPVYLVLLLFLYRYLGWRRTLVFLVAVALMITVTDQLANFFKYGVQRLRPCYDEDLLETFRLVKKSCGGKFGFYSAHAANSFALAGLFANLFSSKNRTLSFLIIIWAILVAYSRIYIGVHFPLDIICGMMSGLLFGWLFYKLYIFILHKFEL